MWSLEQSCNDDLISAKVGNNISKETAVLQQYFASRQNWECVSVQQMEQTMWSLEQTCNIGYVTKPKIKFLKCIDGDHEYDETDKAFSKHEL